MFGEPNKVCAISDVSEWNNCSNERLLCNNKAPTHGFPERCLRKSHRMLCFGIFAFSLRPTRERGNSKHESNGRDDSSSFCLSFSLVTKLLFVCFLWKGLREEGCQGLVEVARLSLDLEVVEREKKPFEDFQPPPPTYPALF